MKITLDIPDGTVGASFNFVYHSDKVYGGMAMQTRLIGGIELYDGAKIKIEPAIAKED